jgi:hypothetical protein
LREIASEGDGAPAAAWNVMADATAKLLEQIVMIRLELRACYERDDRAGAERALARLLERAGDDDRLTAEIQRWRFKLAS